MNLRYRLNNEMCVLNFSEEYPITPIHLVESDVFKQLIADYLHFAEKQKGEIYNYLSYCANDKFDTAMKDLLKLFKLLIFMDKDEVVENFKDLRIYLAKPHIVLKLVEGIYLYWRRLQRYGLVVNKHDINSLEYESFLDAQTKFSNLILHTYRQIEHSLGFKNLVYRQIIAGVNAGLNLSQKKPVLPDEYRNLEKIPIINGITIHPPFITYSKAFKREGFFKEVDQNPICDLEFGQAEWFCYPAKVGRLLIFVYVNGGFMSHGVALSNLFEMADPEEYMNKKPDLIYVCGYNDNQKQQIFYQDDKNDIIVGYLSLNDAFDYFGYMKKMILTLHNIKQINQECLPIHGAMVEITFLDGTNKNVIIMGDSGAGKSETIEQLKSIGSNVIDQVKTVYDDMGVLIKREDGKIVSSGTEIGAFVRLDDLDTGYGYKELDRAVLMNPDKTNARIVVPTAQWNDVTWKYDIDYIMYANNYDNTDSLIDFFDEVDSALEVFRSGKRMAKGTTNEKGITQTYFANPFGPVQRQEQTEILLQRYFKDMFDQGVKVGQIYTGLGIEGLAHKGPKNAAKQFLEILKN